MKIMNQLGDIVFYVGDDVEILVPEKADKTGQYPVVLKRETQGLYLGKYRTRGRALEVLNELAYYSSPDDMPFEMPTDERENPLSGIALADAAKNLGGK